MNQLTLKWKPDDDGTDELCAEFNANGFSGYGSAWFDKIRLLEQSKAFEEYPIDNDQRPTLEGGFWDRDQKNKLFQEHLHISAYPIDSTGHLGMQVRASTAVWPDTRKESQHYVAVELQTTYEEIGRFAKQLRALVNGTMEEITLSQAKQ